MSDYWNPNFIEQHPMFRILKPFARHFVESHAAWPELRDYQAFLEAGVGKPRSASGAPFKFVPQAGRPTQLEDGYEPRIFLRGEIQTRQENWHDFFQVLIWRMFPRSKTALNQLHYTAIKRRVTGREPKIKQRSAMENVLTQFDECGGIILSTSESLLNDIKNHAWKKLFWENRESIARQLKCIVFGHALLEKGLSPYVGMTAHCVMLHLDSGIFDMADQDLVPQIDHLLSTHLLETRELQTPADLQPFPLLGLPGWHCENQHESFYDNVRYFRPARRTENQFTK